MKVTYTAPSSYTISIPSSITVGKDAPVSASKVLLGKDEALSVSVSSAQYAGNSWQLKNGDNSIPYTIKDKEADAPISNNKTVFTARNGEAPSVILSTALAKTTEPLSYAGDYTDTLVFSVASGIDLGSLTETYVIKDSETHTFIGSGSYGIKVVSGDPTIKLVNASININEDYKNAIDVVGGNATIHVTGNSSVYANRGAGIHVAEGKTVTITGNSREDQLTAASANGGAGIGGYVDSSYNFVNCGNITITNVHVEAPGSNFMTAAMSAGIGGCGLASCGTITIDNATVYAYGAFALGEYDAGSPAIGVGCSFYSHGGDLLHGSCGSITIQNGSEVYAYRGSEYSDYIGYCGNVFQQADGAIRADIKDSKVTKLN